ncbi:flagellin lysine-N-methylase [Clostridium sp. YIM B02555]|uniref:flagellin lysine-N-methylase n=1 Tax=Clostridium sp. YIM B02555 TaxID=2911968 RepID=UPI001EEE637E|nr:flagellin lysine-N-methylase [Clostridium sp. YIM B02555]
MDKTIDILKTTNYDKFKCTADKCKLTCCEGWDVSVDADTYNKWEKDKCSEILKNIKVKKSGDNVSYSIAKENHETCPFLDMKGLCEIVKKHGEEYISSICHTFPRVENKFEDRREFSLSCACPEVVEIISGLSGKINIFSDNKKATKNNLLELKVRDTLVNIVQKDNFLLEEKLLVCFQMLLNILEDEELSEEGLEEELEKYEDSKYLQEVIGMCKEIDSEINESVEEINYLLLDITKNYKEVSSFELLLKDISDFAEAVKVENLSVKWQEYKILFEQHSEFAENWIVSDIISSCISDDIEELIISFELIILEYLMVRYAVFLKYCINNNKEIEIQDIKDYIVTFSRIIGNNSEAVTEFLRDGFEDPILEIGYLCFISLF